VKGLLEKQPSMQVVVLTGYGSIATAVEAVRLGALDYLTKPCHADRVLGAFEPKEPGEARAATFETPSLARLEREHIERVLTECGGNVSKAARVLGVHRRTLQYKLAKYPVQR
jgi:two-component system response regulator RegA